jgi:hypothetical protein
MVARATCLHGGSVLVEILGRHIVFRNLSRMHLGNVGVGHVLDGFDDVGLDKLPLVHQFFHALRLRLRAIRETLIIAGLACGIRTRVLVGMVLHAPITARAGQCAEEADKDTGTAWRLLSSVKENPADAACCFYGR